MEIDNFEEFYILQLQRLLDGEQQLVKALPNMAAAAQSEDLRKALLFHQRETQGQVKRLEKVLAAMGEDAKPDSCDVTLALIDEADDLVAAIERSELRDAALVGACNKIEHLEIAAYDAAKILAQRLGRAEAVELLEQTLAEEKAASQKLVELGQTVF